MPDQSNSNSSAGTADIGTLVPIRSVTVELVQQRAREALATSDYDLIADFNASVDWSFVDPQALPPIADLLGELSLRDTEYVEGDISEDEYRAYLLGLLPESERAAFAAASVRADSR